MGLPQQIMNGIASLDQNASCKLRFCVTVTRRNIRTNKFGFETTKRIASILWRKLSSDLKNAASLNIFKHKIKKWTPKNCLYKICSKKLKKLEIYMTIKKVKKFDKVPKEE